MQKIRVHERTEGRKESGVEEARRKELTIVTVTVTVKIKKINKGSLDNSKHEVVALKPWPKSMQVDPSL